MGNQLPGTDRPTRQARIAEGLELAAALFSRSALRDDADRTLETLYPNAPRAMIETAVHHVYVDGCEAALEFVAAAERLLRDPHTKDGPHVGVTWEVLHHVYNWHLFQTLLPEARPTMMEMLAELREAVETDDRGGIVRLAKQLEEIVTGDCSPPTIER